MSFFSTRNVAFVSVQRPVFREDDLIVDPVDCVEDEECSRKQAT